MRRPLQSLFPVFHSLVLSAPHFPDSLYAAQSNICFANHSPCHLLSQAFRFSTSLSMTHSPTHLLTHSLTHSLSLTLTLCHSLSYSLSHSLTQTRTYAFSHPQDLSQSLSWTSVSHSPCLVFILQNCQRLEACNNECLDVARMMDWTRKGAVWHSQGANP
jgi:hypothetical protein